MKTLRKYYLEYRRRKSLRNIRAMLKLSDLTDEEIERGCQSVRELIAKVGFNAKEANAAAAGLAKIGLCVNPIIEEGAKRN